MLRSLPLVLTLAVPILAAALTAATPANAQTDSGQTESGQSESAQSEPTQTETGETEAEPAEGSQPDTTQAETPQAGTTQEDASAQETAGETAPAATAAPAAVETAECAWIGQRILVLLWRDDIDTANDFFTVYDRFGCPMGHAGPAFRCLVTLGATPDDADLNLPDRARACWENPAMDPAAYVPPAQVAPQVE